MQPLEAGDVESAVERGDDGHGAAPRERHVNTVDVAMDHVEAIGLREHGFAEKRVQRDRCSLPTLEPQGVLTSGHELGRGVRVPARKQRNAMPLAHQLLGQI